MCVGRRLTNSPLHPQSSPFKRFAGGLIGLQLEPSRSVSEDRSAQKTILTIVVRDHTLEFLLLVPSNHLLSIRNHIGNSDTLESNEGLKVDKTVVITIGIG